MFATWFYFNICNRHFFTFYVNFALKLVKFVCLGPITLSKGFMFLFYISLNCFDGTRMTDIIVIYYRKLLSLFIYCYTLLHN